MTFNQDALDLMVNYSNGLPLMMQQIGDSIFWLNHNINDTITEKLAEEGIIDAANQIASKQIRPILAHITEEEYTNILIKITRLNHEFKKPEIRACLDEEEKEVLDTFLEDMIDLNVLTDIGSNRKIYKFTNQLLLHILPNQIDREKITHNIMDYNPIQSYFIRILPITQDNTLSIIFFYVLS